MSDNDIKEQVRQFVTSALRFPELGDDDDIFIRGGASSLFAAELVVFVEDALAVQLEDDDLVRENFATINAVTDLAVAKGRVE